MMLIRDMSEIGNRLLAIRKKAGLTQTEVAEIAGLSDRTYADIERGSVNMRTETLLRICEALQITPDELFAQKELSLAMSEEELIQRLNTCSIKEKETALLILEIYLQSL